MARDLARGAHRRISNQDVKILDRRHDLGLANLGHGNTNGPGIQLHAGDAKGFVRFYMRAHGKSVPIAIILDFADIFPDDGLVNQKKRGRN